jgi:hypothetical protein
MLLFYCHSVETPLRPQLEIPLRPQFVAVLCLCPTLLLQSWSFPVWCRGLLWKCSLQLRVLLRVPLPVEGIAECCTPCFMAAASSLWWLWSAVTFMWMLGSAAALNLLRGDCNLTCWVCRFVICCVCSINLSRGVLFLLGFGFLFWFQ